MDIDKVPFSLIVLPLEERDYDVEGAPFMGWNRVVAHNLKAQGIVE